MSLKTSFQINAFVSFGKERYVEFFSENRRQMLYIKERNGHKNEKIIF